MSKIRLTAAVAAFALLMTTVAADRLLAAPGVHSVAIGGKKTNEPAIVVFVTKKRAAA